MRQTGKTGHIELFDEHGNRKYLDAQERLNYAAFATDLPRELRTFCMLLHHSGCRLQEGLNTTIGKIDFTSKCVVFETLKRRRKRVFRQVPLSDGFLDDLNLVYDMKELQKKKKNHQQPIWTFSKRTAQRRVSQLMVSAGIQGAQACAKGVRHGFAIHAVVEKKIPPPYRTEMDGACQPGDDGHLCQPLGHGGKETGVEDVGIKLSTRLLFI